MKKYRVGYSDEIQPFEISRETEKTVFFINANRGNREDRELKNSDYHKWFDTFNEAKQYLISKYTKEIEIAEYRLRDLKEKMVKVQNYTEL